MMLPARTSSPPKRLTPRRLEFESRPLRVEPPAFLWAKLASFDERREPHVQPELLGLLGRSLFRGRLGGRSSSFRPGLLHGRFGFSLRLRLALGFLGDGPALGEDLGDLDHGLALTVAKLAAIGVARLLLE